MRNRRWIQTISRTGYSSTSDFWQYSVYFTYELGTPDGVVNVGILDNRNNGTELLFVPPIGFRLRLSNPRFAVRPFDPLVQAVVDGSEGKDGAIAIGMVSRLP